MSDASNEALRLAAEAEEAPEVPQQPDTLWLARRLEELQQVRRVLAENERVRADMHARVDMRCDKAEASEKAREAQLASWVRDYCTAFRSQLLPPKKKSRAFPGGTVGWKQKPLRLVVTDCPAVDAWAEWNGLATKRVVADMEKVRAHFKATGDVPPGCETAGGEDEFFLSTEEK